MAISTEKINIFLWDLRENLIEKLVNKKKLLALHEVGQCIIVNSIVRIYSSETRFVRNFWTITKIVLKIK